MLMVISPAKRLDFSPAPEGLAATAPAFAEDVAELAKVTRRLKRVDLRRMMSISADLAALNVARFQAFDADDGEAGVQAALAFAGDVYIGLQARTMSAADLEWAQGRLRILSGMYGLLRPLDRIQPYRLEMGVSLKTRRGKSLYDFWGARIAQALNAASEGMADPVLVNLASQEYFGAVDFAALAIPHVNVHFREVKDGESRVLAFHAKKARGMMARRAVKNRARRAADLRGFDEAGYAFDDAASTEADWVFARPQPEPQGRVSRKTLA